MVFDVLLLFILILVFVALGKRVFKLTKTEFSSFVEEIVFSFGLGTGIIALLTLGIGLVGGLKSWIFYILTFGLLGVLIFDVKNILLDAIRWVRAKRGKPRPLEATLLIIVGLNLFFTFFNALGPPTDWDSLGHHLLVPDIYIRNSRIFNMFSPVSWSIIQSNYPSNMEMLFMLGMLLKSDVLATLIAWSVTIFLALSVYSFSRQFFSSRTSLIAMAILYCSPAIAVYATYTLVDTGVAIFALLALYAAFKCIHSMDHKFLVFSGIYAGFSAGTKYTGLPVVLVVGLLILMMSALERRRLMIGVKYMLLFGLIALAVAAPWYIKNYVYTLNPVYPFFAKILGGEYIPPGAAGHAISTGWKGADDYSTWYGLLLSYIRFAWDLTMMRGEFSKPASIGPLYLLFIPCLIFFRNIDRRIKYLLFHGLLGLAVIFALAQRPRYMFPFVPPLAIVASYSVCRISGYDGLIKRISLFILVAAMILNMSLDLFYIRHRSPVVLGLESRHEHISRTVIGHEVILYINKNLPDSARVLSTDPRLYYCERQCIYDGAIMGYESFQGDEMKLLGKLKGLNISHILLNPAFFSDSRRGSAPLELYRKLFDRGKLRGIFAKKGLSLYVLI
jgi:4-amino-4-deoxy-L-arabinose transferase-like glycosyltransferase